MTSAYDPHAAAYAAANPGILAADLAVNSTYRWWNGEIRVVLKVMEAPPGRVKVAVGRPTRTTSIYVGVHEFAATDRVLT